MISSCSLLLPDPDPEPEPEPEPEPSASSLHAPLLSFPEEALGVLSGLAPGATLPLRCGVWNWPGSGRPVGRGSSGGAR